MQSSRDRRINRALASVLSAIDQQYANAPAETWRELDERSIAADTARIAAYERADQLRERWRARIAAIPD